MSCDTDFEMKTDSNDCIDTDLLSRGMFDNISSDSERIISGFADLTRIIQGENVKSVYTNELFSDYMFTRFKTSVECEYLYLVGDIIDGWQLKKKFFWNQSHNDFIQKVLGKARKGTKVTYVIGNHDEVLRKLDNL